MKAVWTAAVRYVECDQQGVVFNAHYLTWCDEAFTAWLRATGTPYDALLARRLDTMLVASSLEWQSPARYGEVVEVDAEVQRLGRTSFVLDFRVRVGDRECCRVSTTYVLTDLAGKPVALPEDLRAAWTSDPDG